MPIVFEQPQPLDPAVSTAYGAAEMAAKMNPGLVSLYESAINARRGGGGGGGGGGHTSGGGIQVLPTSDGGALAQVESQANREQQALNIGAESQQQSSLLNQRFNLQNLQADRERAIQQQQDAAEQNRVEGQPQAKQPAQPTPTFTPGDAKSLADAQQDLSKIDMDENSGEISGQEAYQSRQAVNAKIAALQQKQDQANQVQKQKAQAERDESEAHQHGSWMREQGVMQKYSPGQKLPSGETVVSSFADGSPSVIRHWDAHTHSYKYEHLKPSPTLKTPADLLQERKFDHEEKILKSKQQEQALKVADDRMAKFRDQAARELAPKSLADDKPSIQQIEERALAIKAFFDKSHKKDGIDVGDTDTQPSPAPGAAGGGQPAPMPTVRASPEFAQRQVSLLDGVAKKIITPDMPPAQAARANGVLAELKSLIVQHGGDLSLAKPEVKAKAKALGDELKAMAQPTDNRPELHKSMSPMAAGLYAGAMSN